MDTNVKERLVAFIEYKGLSKNKFETKCGLSRRYVSNISRSISPEMIKKISLTFPELDMGWILTGEGKMLKDGASDSAPQQPASLTLTGDAVQMFLDMSKTISRQEENIAKLTGMVDRLTGGVEAPKKIANG